jgi:FkbM family methyltransferase
LGHRHGGCFLLLQATAKQLSVSQKGKHMVSDSQHKHWECLIAYNALGGYVVPKSSSARNCSQHILNGRVFEPRMPEFVAKHVGQGDIVHAGTFFGDFLPAFSRAMAPGARVWAYEPVAENYACAKATMELNRIENVSLHFAGLGEALSEGVVVTHDAAGMALGEVAYVSTSMEDRVGDTETIRIVSIDETVPSDRHVAIIQLDVEGFEEPALSGALKTIARCKPILVLETLPPPAWVSRHLEPLGYSVREGVHANVVLSVTATGGLANAARWRARSMLKAMLPAKWRQRLRSAEAAQRASRMPTAADSGALDCRLAQTADGALVCAPLGADLAPCAKARTNAAGAVLVHSARYGQDLPRLAAAGQPVLVVEPDADMRRYARMTAILNRLDNVRVEADEASFKPLQ